MFLGLRTALNLSRQLRDGTQVLTEVVDEPSVFVGALGELVGVLHLHGQLPLHLPVLRREGQIEAVGADDVPPEDIPNGQRHGKAAPLTEPAGDHRLKGRQQSVPEKKRCIEGGGEKQRRSLGDLLPDRPEGRSQQIDRGTNLEAENQQGEYFHHRDRQVWRQQSVAEGCQAKQPARDFHRQGNWASGLTEPVLQRYHQHHHGITHGDLQGIPGPGWQGGGAVQNGVGSEQRSCQAQKGEKQGVFVAHPHTEIGGQRRPQYPAQRYAYRQSQPQPPAEVDCQGCAQGRGIDQPAVKMGVIPHRQQDGGETASCKGDHAVLGAGLVVLQVRFPHLQFQISVEIEPIGGVDLRQLQAVLGGGLRQIQGQRVGPASMGRHPVRLVKAGAFPDGGIDHVVLRAVCRPLLRGEKYAGVEGPAVDEKVEVGLPQFLIRQGQQAIHRLGAGAGIFVVPDIQAQAQGGAQHHGQQQGQQLTVDRLHRRHLLQRRAPRPTSTAPPGRTRAVEGIASRLGIDGSDSSSGS